MESIDPFELHQLRVAHRDDVSSELRVMAWRRELLRLQEAAEAERELEQTEHESHVGGAAKNEEQRQDQIVNCNSFAFPHTNLTLIRQVTPLNV